MTSLQIRTLHTLEWPQVTQSLAERTRSPLGAALALEHRPYSSAAACHRMQSRVAESVTLLAQVPIFHSLLSGTGDPGSFFLRASREGILEPLEIFTCGHFMNTVGLIAAEFKGRQQWAPLLVKDFEAAPQTPALCDQITRAVNGDGQILDTASSELARLRGSRWARRASFEKLLSSRVKEWHQQGFLQDDFYDVLEGRFVVPVRADQQSKLSGNLFSRSQSRQSLYIEPTEFVTANNEIQELEGQIRSEEYRILKDLTHKIRALAPAYQNWIAPLGELDLFFAAATLAKDWKLSKPKTSSQTRTLNLRDLFHPLLPLRGVDPVKNSLCLSSQNGHSSLLISGPNTGGKTVFIKAVALSTIMAQAGLFVPAFEDAEVPHYAGVVALIGDDQNISEGLSSFSAQIKDIKEVVLSSDHPQLIIIDEILSSTDPEEASALAQSILEDLIERGHHVMVTTHFSDLAIRSRQIPKMSVAAMEFKDGKPTYRLRPNELGSSHAIEVADRLGFPNTLLERARSLMSQARVDYEKALRDLHEKEKQLEQNLQLKAAALQEDLELREAELFEERTRLREHYSDFVDRSQKKIDDTVRTLTSRIQTYARQGVLSHEKMTQRSESAAKGLVEDISQEARREIQKATKSETLPKAAETKIEKGCRVRVKSLGNAVAEVLEVSGDKANLVMGKIKLQKNLSDLELIAGTNKTAGGKSAGTSKKFFNTSMIPDEVLGSTSLDLRGRRYDDAMAEAQRFLDLAFRSGTPLVRVITGHGTGALKTGLKDLLRNLPYIRESRPEKENNDGALIIEFDL